MILQALNDYYERKAAEPGSEMPPYGFGVQKISFCLVLSESGELIETVDLRDRQEKKYVPRPLNAPMLPFKRAVGIAPNFTWDNTGYVLGVDGKGKAARTQETHDSFKKLQRKVSQGVEDVGLRALLRFLNSWTPDCFSSLSQSEEMRDTNLVFRLESDIQFLHERPAIQQAWAQEYRRLAGTCDGFCLVTGQEATIASLHPDISGVAGAQPSGALLVSFNLPAFRSYGKEQSLNAPVGERAAFAYTTQSTSLSGEGVGRRFGLETRRPSFGPSEVHQRKTYWPLSSTRQQKTRTKQTREAHQKTQLPPC